MRSRSQGAIVAEVGVAFFGLAEDHSRLNIGAGQVQPSMGRGKPICRCCDPVLREGFKINRDVLKESTE